MRLRISAQLVAVCCLAAAAHAQSPQVNGSVVEYQFSWHDNGNNDGILQPGEGAVMSLTIAFTPPSGSPITWNPVIGGSGQGDLRGIQAMFFDLVGSPLAQGTWSDLWIDPGWDGGPPWLGTPAMGGSRLNNVQMGQFPASQAAVITTNPLMELWRGTWKPASYGARTETFLLQSGTANPFPFPSYVIVRDPALPAIVLVGSSAHIANPIVIPIVPGPSTSIAGSAALLIIVRRRRSTQGVSS